MAKTTLDPQQFKDLAALGSVSEVRELAGDGYSFEDIKSILESQRSAKDGDRTKDVAAQAEIHAQAQKRAIRPENEQHPHRSVYSYPEGDIARPRPKFRCPTYWRGQQLDLDTSTAVEIELVNRLEPGSYRLERPDGSPLKVEVLADRDPITGAYTKIDVKFDEGKGLRNSLSSCTAMLREMLAQQPPKSMLVTA